MGKSLSSKLVEITTLAEQMVPLVTVQTLRVFVAIAKANEEENGLKMTELGKRLGLPSATRTNVVNALSIKRAGNFKLPGLGLVTTEQDPNDGRAKVILLTPKGKRFWAALKQALEN